LHRIIGYPYSAIVVPSQSACPADSVHDHFLLSKSDTVRPSIRHIRKFADSLATIVIVPTIKLPLPDGESITAQGVAIVQAVAAGILAPSQGAALLTGLGTLARIKEIDELTARIAALEGMKNGND
jgi:hypothetical protein